LISVDSLRDAEFVFHEGDWYLTQWGSDPFAPLEPKHDRWQGGAGGGATAVDGVPVSLDFVMGFSDLQFRRDEVMAVWPEPEKTSPMAAPEQPFVRPPPLDADEQTADSKKGPGKPPGAYYQRFCDWLQSQYANGTIDLDAPISSMVPTIRTKWAEYCDCEANHVPAASRELPENRQLREVIKRVREQARQKILPK
jgi:hypothetical protein